MSTKSLDLSLPIRHHRRQLSNELTASQFTKELKPMKLDSNKLQSYEELGARLLEDRMLLSALELYAELGEAGHEILCLKQFFSNPGNFEKSAKTDISRTLIRSLSQTTLDSLDYATISEDGDRAGGDRVAILEFELRKAKETITALRENLTHQVELEQNANSSRSETESNSSRIAVPNTLHQQSTPEPMRAYEQKAINFLIHEYLLTHGYRLTSITFADENPEQDFEHWDDVGLNTERPPDILSIYRHRNRPIHHLLSTHAVQTEHAETQTNESSDLLHESDSADVTIQMCVSGTSICADESSGMNNTSQDNVLSSKLSAVESISSSASIRPTSTSQLPSESQQQNPFHSSLGKCEPHSAPFPHPPPPLQLEKSARALKEEFQQGVEDVCQKLNSFFGKPPSLTGSSGSASGGGNRLPSAFGAPGKPSDNRPVFSLFNSK